MADVEYVDVRGRLDRSGEIVPRGSPKIWGVSVTANISVLQTEDAGSAPARPAICQRGLLPLADR